MSDWIAPNYKSHLSMDFEGSRNWEMDLFESYLEYLIIHGMKTMREG